MVLVLMEILLMDILFSLLKLNILKFHLWMNLVLSDLKRLSQISKKEKS
jgi:hypothetical protein